MVDEEVKEQSTDEIIKAVREEYEQKIADLTKQFQEEKDKAISELKDDHIKQLRALISSGTKPEETKIEEQSEKNFEDDLLDKLRNKK